MQTSTPIRPLAAALLCGLAFAACGAEEPAGSTADTPQERNREAGLAYAKCMRENGVDVPDPQPGEGGMRLMGPDENVSPGTMRKADAACRKHLEDIEAPELSEEQRKEMQEGALAHVRCMREHGIDMPDPTFDENGGVQIRIGGPDGKGPRPGDPKFRKAQEACRDELPGGGAFQEDSP